MLQHIAQCKCKLIKDSNIKLECANDKHLIGKLNQIIKQEITVLRNKIVVQTQGTQVQNEDNNATEELIRLKQEASQRIDSMSQSLLRQNQQLQQSYYKMAGV